MSIGEGSYFRRYWIGQALSNLGTRTASIAYPLLALALTHSPALAGLLGFARFAPWFVFSLPAGAIIDRVDRKRLMILCDLASAVAVGSIVVALAAGRLTYVHLLVVATAEGISSVFFTIAEVGAVRRLVHEAELPKAIAQNTARISGAWLVGPPLGGALYAIRSFLPFAVDTLSYIASALTLASIRARFNEPRSEVRPHLIEITEGIAWVWRHGFVRVSTLLVGGTNFISNAVALLMVITVRERGGSAPQIGLMMSCAAAGSLLGAVAANWLYRITSPRTIAVAYPWLAAGAALLLAFQLPPLALGCIYGAWIFFGPTWDAVVGGRRIALTPDALQGRVSSVIGLVAAGAVALGPLAAGLLLEAVGGPASFVCLAVFGAAIAIGGTLAPSLATPERRGPAAAEVGT
jgi:predicted MFS family arabinose efflux permease